jgi:osmotically-inducible protein OsmY
VKALLFISLAITAAVLLTFSAHLHASDTDNRIELSARESHVFKTYLQGDIIRIKSKDGAVTLTGTVLENFHKSLALETVSGLPGVRSVHNKLVVKGDHPTANSDAWLRDKVKVALLFHRSVNATTTKVEVKEGIVTLRGIADNQAEKELTTEYAKYVEGIKEVKNEMTVSSASQSAPRTTGEKIDDASITAQVNMMLLNHRSTSVINTTVKTKHGVVTVGGKAKNTAEKELVTKLVTDIIGVDLVKNRMIIEETESRPRP